MRHESILLCCILAIFAACNDSTGTSGVRGSDTDGDGDGVGETDNCPKDAAEEICGDEKDNDCNGVAEEGCYIEHCGSVTDDETWGPETWGHRITCDVYVQGATSPTLTLVDGTRLVFEAGTGLYIGYSGEGGLTIDGGTQGVLLTSRQRFLGFWKGVYLGMHLRAGTSLKGFILEYAGGSANAAGLFVDGVPSPIALNDAVIENNAGDGVRLAFGSAGSFVGTRFALNEHYGVSLGPTSSLVGDFADNVLTENGLGPIKLPAMSLGNLRVSSSFVGNHRDDLVSVLPGTLSKDMTIADMGVPYRVTGNLYIEGEAMPTVTIDDGTTLLFDVGAGLRVGFADKGNLHVNGSTDGVLFSSTNAGGAGSWAELYFGTGATDSRLTGLTVEHGGAGTNSAGIYIFYATVALNGCMVRDNVGRGVGVRSGVLSMHDTTVRGTTATSTDNGDGVGCFGSDTSILGWTGNTVTGNARYPVVVPASAMAALDADSTYAGNGLDFVVNTGGAASETGTWSGLDVPWLITAETFVQDTEIAVAGSGPVINITDATLLFEEGVAFKVGVLGAGDVIVSGSTFTSAADLPNRGDWVGIIAGGLASSTTNISGSTVEFAGSEEGNILLGESTQATVINNTIRGSANYGIFCFGGCDGYNVNGGTVAGNTFVDNETAEMN